MLQWGSHEEFFFILEFTIKSDFGILVMGIVRVIQFTKLTKMHTIKIHINDISIVI